MLGRHDFNLAYGISLTKIVFIIWNGLSMLASGNTLMNAISYFI